MKENTESQNAAPCSVLFSPMQKYFYIFRTSAHFFCLLNPRDRYLLADVIFVVGDKNKFSSAAVFGIEFHHGVTGRTHIINHRFKRADHVNVFFPVPHRLTDRIQHGMRSILEANDDELVGAADTGFKRFFLAVAVKALVDLFSRLCSLRYCSRKALCKVPSDCRIRFRRYG